jgi:hypothetical protein
MLTGFGGGNPKERDYFEDLEVEEKIKLKIILNK